MQSSIFETIIILLIICILITTSFRAIKLPAIVGYIVVGILVGPYSFQLVADSHNVRNIAEFGVVFLMFTIGLEFSLRKMIAMKKLVFGLGAIQVLLSLVITTLIGTQFDMSLAETLVVSGIVALSSTAIVMKQLKEQSEIASKHGRNAVGILLFQDLAVIPLLILIPQLANVEIMSLSREMSWAFVKGILAFGIILSLGHWLLRPFFSHVAKTKSLELFTLMSLLITLASAWLTQKLGLSLALGAFLAGMMLSETEFKPQIEADIRPFRDVLLGFFFISVGMQLNINTIIMAWPWVILLLLALVIFKTALITTICYVFDRNKEESLRTGLALAQGSEFGFAVLSLAMHYKLLRPDYSHVILCALLLSMALAPIIISNNQKISHFLLRIKAAQSK